MSGFVEGIDRSQSSLFPAELEDYVAEDNLVRRGGVEERSGGGMGFVMFMNVWMIIWPLQQKIIAATKATAETGAPAPADMPKWARRAFLASRTNAWLSVPMLFFMGAASHFPIFGTVPQ